MIEYVIEETIRKKLGNYVRETRENKGIELNQLALETGTICSFLSKLEDGTAQKISPYLLRGIAKGLDIDYRELYQIVGFLDEKDFKDKTFKNNVKRIFFSDKTNIIEVPVYGKASTGDGNINLKEIIKIEALVNKVRVPKNAFAVKVHGDSMYPTLQEKDLVIVDPICNTIVNNSIYIITYNEETFIKRVIDHGRFLQLISDNCNKEKYRDIIILKDEMGESLKCNGKVIGLERKL